MASRRWMSLCLIIGLMLIASAVVGFYWSIYNAPDRLLQRAHVAYQKEDYNEAERLAKRVLARERHNPRALLLVAKSARERRDFSAALEHLARVIEARNHYALEAALDMGDILYFELHKPADAEPYYRQVLQIDPDNVAAIERMAFLMGTYGRGWDSIFYRIRLVQAHRFNAALLPLGLGYETVENSDNLKKDFEISPDDSLVLLGMSRLAFWRQDYSTSLELAESAKRSDPDLVDAHVRIGYVLFEQKDYPAFLAWNAELPAAAEEHPVVWALRGLWAQNRHQSDAAARCYWECLRLDPNHRQATYQLGRLLQTKGRHDEAELLLNRTNRLTAFANTVTSAGSKLNPDETLLAAQQAEALGLLWEAYGWLQVTLKVQNNHVAARRHLATLVPHLHDFPLRRSDFLKMEMGSLDLSHFPLPDWTPRSVGNQAQREIAANASSVPITFSDVAQEAGVQFTRIDFRVAPGRARTIRETTGGGVAAFDFDGDGWTDLYFTQSSPWPPRDSDTTDLDELYRNLGNGRFQRVTPVCHIVEQRYSQGVTTGDFNDDGFSDLFVANMGTNRLFENNGDGTFRDVSEQMADVHAQWSTSCVLADLNNDRFPDLYVVNYLTGDDVYERICDYKDSLGVCGPQLFNGDQDRLFVNQGDGTFVETTRQSGISVAGKGMGVIAADFTGDRRLSLFIANDNSPNFFFANERISPEQFPVFAERGLSNGLALDGEGQSLACMGIAAGDADANGLIDLFVTNFHLESNTLYLQFDDGMFIDATRDAGLRTSSLPMLGFGTQFIDADLDGQLDLIVTNGHVHDDTSRGSPYHMPPQFYRNLGLGKFVEYSPEQLGPFFEGQYLGRGMARLDWNRDGKDDVVISHIDAPAALLTNTTQTPHHFVSLQLRGVDSSRDAFGATVTATIGERTQVQHLTAGDGYHASNERTLTFGLGEREQIDELVIRWPSGVDQRFESVTSDRRYIAVEENEALVALPSGP